MSCSVIEHRKLEKSSMNTNMLEDTRRQCQGYTCVRRILSYMSITERPGHRGKRTTTAPTWLSIGAADRSKSGRYSIYKMTSECERETYRLVLELR